MVSYRFCRPDDLPLLAEAINGCYNVHFPENRHMDLEGIKKEAKELNLWASSCMAAMEGSSPVAVLIGAKRAHGTLISRIGAKPGYLRQGHASHMVRSLSAKLAIIGPPQLAVELPQRRSDLCEFFEKLGFRTCQSLVDYRRIGGLPRLAAAAALEPLTLEEALGFDQLWLPEPHAWLRARETLLNRKQSLSCLAVVSAETVEAALIYEMNPEEGRITLHRFGGAHRERGPLFLELLLRGLPCDENTVLEAQKMEEAELPGSLFSKWGFTVRERFVRLEATANA